MDVGNGAVDFSIYLCSPGISFEISCGAHPELIRAS